MWKEIPNTDGCYFADSETGKIKSVERKGADGRHLKGKILKPWVQNSGYEVVTLHCKKIQRDFLVHRLVAQTFLIPEEHQTDINHKDGNKRNNKLDNLEYTTRSENIRHSVDHNLTTPRVARYHKVHMLDTEGVYQESFNSIKEAAQYVGVTSTQIIYALQGKSHTAGGFMWVDDYMFECND